MKQYYKFGELIMALREEYRECKHMLVELGSCVNVVGNVKDYHFSGMLSNINNGDLSDRRIELIVERHYLDILKKIQYLRYDWYSRFLYLSSFQVEKNDGGLYSVHYKDICSPVGRKKYIPEVTIIDYDKFSLLIDKLFASDLMQIKAAVFDINHDSIFLNFDKSFIGSHLGNYDKSSFVSYNAFCDEFSYELSIYYRHPSFLISDILSLEIPADKLSDEWLKLLEKHKNISEFIVDEVECYSRKGILGISEIKESSDDKKVVTLVKRPKRNKGSIINDERK